MRDQSWIGFALAGLLGCSETPPGGDAAVEGGADAGSLADVTADAPIDAGRALDVGAAIDVRSDAARDVGVMAADAGVDARALDAPVPRDAGVDVFTPDVGTDAADVFTPDVGTDAADVADAADAGVGVWRPIAVPAGFLARRAHTAVWTGTRMIVFGGENNNVGESRMSTGASYQPATDSWSLLPTVGARARARHTAVWTGTRMIVWGGRLNDSDSAGEMYDPATDTWSSISSLNAPPPRSSGHSAVWTGTEMIVWGGTAPNGTRYDTGGRYDPARNRWTTLSTTGAPRARNAHVAVWTGTEMVVWGGGSSSTLGDGAAYDPARDAWRTVTLTGAPSPRLSPRAVWTGTEMVVWGGSGGADLGGAESRNGGIYNPVRDAWTLFETPSVRSVRFNAAVWTGAELMVWGGSTGSSPEVYVNEGAAFAPASSRLTLLPTLGAPTSRTTPSAVWTGSEMIVWGGLEGTTLAATGARYRP